MILTRVQAGAGTLARGSGSRVDKRERDSYSIRAV
jgi:hypothetical protein